MMVVRDSSTINDDGEPTGIERIAGITTIQIEAASPNSHGGLCQ